MDGPALPTMASPNQKETFVTNAPINLAVGSQVGGLNILTTADQGESLQIELPRR